MKKVALIILVYNGEKYLSALLQSLQRQNTDGLEVKTIIVDNASTDHSVEFIRKKHPEVFIMENRTNLGFAAGNNLGMKYALDYGFDYIGLLNQDIRVDKDWLQYLVRKLENDNNLGSVQPLIKRWPEQDKINSAGNVFHYLGVGYSRFDNCLEKEKQNYLTVEINYASGAAVLFSVAALKKTGLFDESFFMYHEDTDLSLRMKMLGYGIKLVPESKVYHEYEFSRSIKKFYYIERNRYTLLLKFYKWPTLILILPAFLFLESGMICQSILRGYFKERVKAYKYFFNLNNLRNIFKNRKIIQQTRRLSDRELIREASGVIMFQEVDNSLLSLIANPILSGYKKILEKVIFW